MTPAIETIAAPHANGTAPAPTACAPIPAVPTDRLGSGLYILRETPTEKVVCTTRLVPDAAGELAKVRPAPPGWSWATLPIPAGRVAGTPCPSRPGWRHLTFQMVPKEARS